jgi:hypothetical protein
MKKLLLCGSALLLSLGFVNAQGGLTATGAYDDFQNGGVEYTGLNWTVPTTTSQLAITRSIGYMTVQGAAGSNQYPYFAVNFGTNLNLKTNNMADVQFDIQNTSTSQFMFMDIKLVDVNGTQSSIEPDVSDVTPTTQYSDNTGAPYYYTHRKAFNAVAINPGERHTFRIDLSSIPANLGGLTWVSCTGTTPYTCPNTTYNIDPTQIKGINFEVNYGTGSIDICQGTQGDSNPVKDTLIGSGVSRFTDAFKIYNFKIGTAVTGVNEASVIDNSLKVYPNPAKESLTVSFTSTSGAEVSLTDIVGNKVFSTSASAGDSQTIVNTSGLTTGMYILNVTTDNGKTARKISIK